MTLLEKLQNKRQLLDEILNDLESLKSQGTFNNSYALEANIAFFKAMYSIPTYLKWFFTIRPHLDGSRLLELSDLSVYNKGRWERLLQRELIEIQRWQFPDTLKFIREKLREL